MAWTDEQKRESDRRYYAANAEARKTSVREYKRDNPRKVLAYRLKQFGLTIEQYDALLEEQDDRCAICVSPYPGQRNWHVDHDHNIGKVRGLLCSACNTGLGHFQDDPARMRAAIAYLEKQR